MRYLAFATDYDGTLATDGAVAESTVRALENLKASGRRLLLVTGRHLRDLQPAFARLELFDKVVAENGAVLYTPSSREERVLAEAPKKEFLEALRAAGVKFTVGRAIVSSWTPAETAILEAIKRLGLDCQLIFNKGAVMVLPSGINKATGMRVGLEDLQLSLHNVVAIGDAENDHALLSQSECGVAVANALPALRETADLVTRGDSGAGVVELIEQLLSDDLRSYDRLLARSAIAIGLEQGTKRGEVRIVPNRDSMLVAGASASGKSSAVAGILEEAEQRGYQFCLIDPEGDFEGFAGAVPIGSPTERPDANMVEKVLKSPQNLIVNLMGVSLAERPGAFAALLPRILETRARTGRPHWLVIDEAHHLLPTTWAPASSAIPQELGGTILITVHPERVSAAALVFVDVVVALGKDAGQTVAEFAKATHMSEPRELPEKPPEPGEALLWLVRQGGPAALLQTLSTRSERRRHKRNYAQGELSPEQSFFFRGPEGRLNLRAQNLLTFLQLGEGVDEETWLFHLRRGDFAHWFESVIKDEELASCARDIERAGPGQVAEGRKKLREAVEKRYTAPA